MNEPLDFHLQQLAFAWRMVWESAPRWTLLSLLLLVVQGFMPLISLYLYKLIIDAIEGTLTGAAAVTTEHLLLLIGLATAAGLTANFASVYARYVGEVQGLAVTDKIQTLIQRKSVALELVYFEDPAYHDQLHRAQHESAGRPVRIVNSMVGVVQNSLSLVLLAGLLLSFHWSIPLILAGAALPGVLWQLRRSGTIYTHRRHQAETERKARYWHWLLTAAKPAREVRLFNLGDTFNAHFTRLRKQLRGEKRQLAGMQGSAQFVTMASSTIAIYIAFGLIAFQTVQGITTLGTLVVTYQAFKRAQGFIQGVIASATTLYQNNLFLADISEFLNLPTSMNGQQASLPPMQESLRLENVSFSYPNSSRQAVRGVSMTIKRGQVVAFVGANGAGKTTLVKLICRLYDPDEGSILVDGCDLRAYPATAWHEQLAVIFQDYVWYHQMTVRDNIALGRVDAPIDEKAIEQAARLSGADSFITTLPEGYDSLLGNLFSNGKELSVGQWQRLALARAFYRNANLLILDEPSSALDALAEAEMFASFKRLVSDQTAILISHRLANVTSADCIFVLEQGCLVECGTHEELLARGGRYRQLYETQAQGYQ